MARVYVSSTITDLRAERQAVMDWLVAAQHQVVHSYRPDSDTVRDSCLADVDTCDLYVLILGHRYGFQPPEDNPEHLSITQLEFRRAGQEGKPRVVRLAPRPPFLAGREDLLAELEARLAGGDGVGPRVVALHGLAGAGKTSVALAYCAYLASCLAMRQVGDSSLRDHSRAVACPFGQSSTVCHG